MRQWTSGGKAILEVICSYDTFTCVGQCAPVGNVNLRSCCMKTLVWDSGYMLEKPSWVLYAVNTQVWYIELLLVSLPLG